MPHLTRRTVLLSLAALPSCATIGALNDAATPRDTFALQPLDLTGGGRRTPQTLLVVEPSAPAALATDRILIKPNALSVTYLPAARWADTLPLMMSSVLIQTLSGTGRIGFVGAQGEGPIPDVVLLTRIDRFGVDVGVDGTLTARIALHMTVLRDQDQRILATRRFSAQQSPVSDQPDVVVRSFQTALDSILPEISNWVIANI